MKKQIRIKVKPHTRRLYRKRIKVRGYTRRILKNYAAFKFASPWEQLRKTGFVEPDYARFGADRLILPKERKIMELRGELQRLQPEKELIEITEEIEPLEIIKSTRKIKEISEKDRMALNVAQQKTKPKETTILPPATGKEKTMKQMVHEHKSMAGQKSREEIEKKIGDPFEAIDNWTEENKKRARNILVAKLTKDPRGRDISIPQKIQETIHFVNQEIASGKQKSIKDVVSFHDSDFINALKDAGFSQQESTDFILRLPSEAFIGKTPKDIVKLKEGYEKEVPVFSEGEFTSANKFESLSTEGVSGLLDKLIAQRPDLKDHNRIQLTNKLRKDLKQSSRELGEQGASTESEIIGVLVTFFSHDKPLKDSLKEEKVLSSLSFRQKRLRPRELNFEDIRILPKSLLKLNKERDQTFDEMMKTYLHPEQRKLKNNK